MASMKYELQHGVLAKIKAGEPIFVFRANDPISLRVVQLYSAMLAGAIEALGSSDEKKRIELQEKMISCNSVAEAMKQYDPSKHEDELPAVDWLRVKDLLSGEFDVEFKEKTNND